MNESASGNAWGHLLARVDQHAGARDVCLCLVPAPKTCKS